jgi:2-methylcitrate dehydratase PrpD
MAAETLSAESDRSDLARLYADFSSALQFADLPAGPVDAVTLNLFDTLACSLAGPTATGMPELTGLVTDWGGKPEASILWSNTRVPAPQAAWLNGSLCHARDYDDAHDKAILHAGVSVIPAALAAVEIAGRPVSGRDFYAAIAAGLEMICRMGLATKLSLIQTGFLYTSLFGYFAATATACRVLNMSPADTLNAFGIVLSQAAGSHQVTRDAAWTKRMGPGFAARGALNSVAMARAGIRGASRVFDGEDGLNRIYLQSSLDGEAMLEGLGRKWQFEDLSYKPYPCCRFNHTAIDAALALRAQPGFDSRNVTEIRAYINSASNQAVGTPLHIRQAPETVVQAQFSICYAVACALFQGVVGLGDFSLEALSRPDIRALTAKLTPLVDAEIERKWGRNVGPTRLEAVVDGKVFTAQVDEAKGSPGQPMSRTDLRRKLADCLSFGGFDPAQADTFEQGIDGLLASSDVAADIRTLIDTVSAGAPRRAAA